MLWTASTGSPWSADTLSTYEWATLTNAPSLLLQRSVMAQIQLHTYYVHQPGSPSQNAWIESFNEFLNLEHSIAESKQKS
jgi:hypothetical protein